MRQRWISEAVTTETRGSDQFVNSQFPIPVRGDSSWTRVPSDKNRKLRITELVISRVAAAATQTYGLAGYQIAFSQEQLKKMYGNKKTYQDRVKRKVEELEKAGWSLPLYRETILADAAKVDF